METILSPAELESFRREILALHKETMAALGKEDQEHIERVARVSRTCEWLGRAMIHVSPDPFTWAGGVALLAAHFILDNMEIGHNVLHGQYDFLKDPRFSSASYRWEFPADEEQWQAEHNGVHHRFTNVLGKDPDLGYERFRITERIPWDRSYLSQPLVVALTFLIFGYAIGHYVATTGRNQDRSRFLRKVSKVLFENYVFFPALAGPAWPKVVAGNALAEIMRNIFAAAVIFCGHFPEGTFVMTEEEFEGGGPSAHHLRQILGSANFEGGRILSNLAGHLNYQIEHHLFPRIPAWRYRTLAPKVQAICEKYGVPYNTGSFASQFASVLRRIIRLSFPDWNWSVIQVDARRG